MEQTPGTTAGGAEESLPEEGRPAGAGPPQDDGRASFASRGRARRRVRFLRKARELAYRDLGGLVFNLHRFGQRNDALVLAKLTTLEQIDRDLRATEAALGESGSLTVLREAGITACPRCAAIHSSEDRFCPNCGLALGPHAQHPAELRAAVPAAIADGAEAPTPPPAAQPSAKYPEPDAQAPQPEPPYAESSQAEPAQADPPQADSPQAETPQADPPQVDPPQDEAGRAEAPHVAAAEPSPDIDASAPPPGSQEMPAAQDDATFIIRPSATGE